MNNWVGRMFVPLKKAIHDWTYSGSVNSNAKSLEWRNNFGVDRCFFQWVLGGDDAEVKDTFSERAVLFALNRVTEGSLSSTNLVPRMPLVLPELMRSLHDSKVSNARIAHHIGQDSSLVAEVMREANSCYYRKADKVLTLDKAVMVLGDIGLRAVIAKASIRPVISQQSGRIARISAPRVWMQSEGCAMAASYFATTYSASAYEAFLAGLIKNLGVMVALRLIDVIHKNPNLTATPALCEAVMAHSLQYSIWVAKIWRLPESIVFALQEMQKWTPSTAAQSALGHSLLMGDFLSKVALLCANGQIAEKNLLEAEFSPNEFDCYKKLTREM